MSIYILNYIFVILWWIVIYKSDEFANYINNKMHKNYSKKQLFLFVVFLQMLLIFGLRDISVGTDTKTYVRISKNVDGLSFIGLLGYYVEYGYVFINKIVNIISFSNFHVLQFVFGSIIYLSVGFFIYRYSRQSLISVCVFIGLGYFSSSMNITRQFLSLSMLILSYQFIEHNDYKKTTGLLILSALFHSSAIIMYPVIFLYMYIKHDVIRLKKILVGSPLMILSIYIIMKMIPMMTSKYDEYFHTSIDLSSLLSFSFIIKLAFLVLSIILLMKPSLKERKYYNLLDKYIADIMIGKDYELMYFLTIMSIVSCAISISGSFLPILSRVNLFFSFFVIISIPNILSYFKLYKKSIYIILILGLFFISIISFINNDAGIIPYKLFMI